MRAKSIQEPDPLFTERDVAALLHLPIARVARAARRGLIRPDYQSRAVKLFLPSRLSEIAKRIGLKIKI